MAVCPKCGEHLKISDWRQHCPHCGVNIVVYDLQERLMQQADIAEVQHYHFQKKIDRLKASFIGSKLAVVRIITSFIPVFALFLPVINAALNPRFSSYSGNISFITAYNNIDVVTQDGFLGSDRLLLVSVALLLLSIALWLVHFLLLMLACSKRAKGRAIIVNALILLTSFGSFFVFIADKSDAVLSGKPAIGFYLYLALQLINVIIDFIVLKQGIPVHHKQCYVGGIPIEEYFELQKTMSPEEIRAEQYKRLQAIQDEKEKEIAKANEAQAQEKEKEDDKESESEVQDNG